MLTRTALRTSLALSVAAAALASPARAEQSIGLQDSFRIGSGGTAVCTAQTMPSGKALADMFDRGYSIVCKDASVPVGQLYALRMRAGDPSQRLASLRAGTARCEPAAAEEVEGLGSVEALSCTLAEGGLAYRVYAKRQRGTLYVAEGFGGYDSALRLGLRTLVADRAVPGEVSVATTGAGDAVAFARVQAGSISRDRALAEAYRRNNSGSYAEAAEFFATLGNPSGNNQGRGEALANQALQRSNLGAYGEAEMLFGQAAPLARGDMVLARQLRNYRAMHLLNQGKVADALTELARPVDDAASAAAPMKELVIDKAIAAQLSAEAPGARRLGASEGLSPQDKAQILDAQALQLKGSALRLQDNAAEAAAALRQAESRLVAVRSGRIAATLWMRAQILADLADIAEAGGDRGEAERQHREAVQLLSTNYPGTPALLSAKGRLASFYARTGQSAPALATFREIVEAHNETGSTAPAMRRILGSYFELLTAGNASASSAAELFRASQLLVRPGVAQTQAMLARELSSGSDEAARLFRQAVNLSREVERARVELTRQQARDPASPRIQALQAALETAQRDQVATQSRLAEYPRYRAVFNGSITLAELQALLRPGEAYSKMVVLGGDTYGLFITPAAAKAYRIAASPRELEQQVDALRSTILKPEGDQLVTLPFDVETAHRLYGSLFGPVAAELAGVNHLIFEPDGAMLRLPPNLLVTDRASVDAYRARAARPNDDGFDFRGVAWLGRGRDISTAVSAPAFRDMRLAAPSRAKAEYIGFGENKPASSFFLPAGGTRGAEGAAGSECGWSLAAWGRPISASELRLAASVLGGAQAEVISGADFTDDGIRKREDLDQYRIVHFATHGLLAPPRPECPSRPALMTSFGGAESDGLLSFGEIFDLRLDADLIILSACDTAAGASTAANREAGISGGGDFALDGLVRAFVGAGGRLVVASHWPVPDAFNSTERLISGLFKAAPGTGTVSALRFAQQALMDDPQTSHPFYWAGFAVVGDGATPVIRAQPTQTASRD